MRAWITVSRGNTNSLEMENRMQNSLQYINADIFQTTLSISFQVCRRITETWDVVYENGDWNKTIDRLNDFEKENPNFEYCLLKICTTKQYLRRKK